MFIETKIALISSEDFEASQHLTKLGIKESPQLNEEDFKYRPFILRIEDIKYVYQSLQGNLLVLELYDTEGQFMLKDDYSNIKRQIDGYYNTFPKDNDL